MSTQSIKDKAREAQMKSFGAEADERLLGAAKALYDNVDALTPEQKTLLVREALVKVSGLIEAIKDTPHTPTRVAYAALGHAVVALAGYAIEEYREEQEFNVTGDRRVDAVLDGVKDLISLYAEVTMSPEENALAEEIKNAVHARVEAGEDFEDAMAEELAKREDRVRAVTNKVPAAKVEETPSRYSGDGLYL